MFLMLPTIYEKLQQKQTNRMSANINMKNFNTIETQNYQANEQTTVCASKHVNKPKKFKIEDTPSKTLEVSENS